MGRAHNHSAAVGASAFGALLGARRGPASPFALQTPPARLRAADLTVLSSDVDLGLRYLRLHGGGSVQALLPLAQALVTPHVQEVLSSQQPQLRGLQHALHIDSPTSSLLAVFVPTAMDGGAAVASDVPVIHRRDGYKLSTICGRSWAESNDWYLPLVGGLAQQFPQTRQCADCAAGGLMAAECRRRPRKRLPSALAKRLLRDTTLRVAVTPPQSSEGLAEAASASWASSAAEILGEHLRAHPESVERALGESDDSAVVTPAEIGRMSAEWWQSLVAEHMRQWGDYPIPVEPEEALRALRSPWGRQSRSDWCRLLCRSFDECGIGTYKLGNWPKGVD